MTLDMRRAGLLLFRMADLSAKDGQDGRVVTLQGHYETDTVPRGAT